MSEYVTEFNSRMNILRDRVGEWSAANFGDNGMGEFKYLRPILGYFEELDEHLFASTEEESDDAIADALIYLLDFHYQIGMPVDYDPRTQASVIGEPRRIFRILLKRIQGIRGYDSDEQYYRELREAMNYEINTLVALKGNNYGDLVRLVEETFNKVVSKRDWRKNPHDGQ